MTRPSMLSITLFCLCGVVQAALAADEERFVLEVPDKQQVEAFKGSFRVPENRRVTGSRTITIKYVRLPATGDKVGPPIIYLAGGPGGAGIAAIKYRYRMFATMRKYGDVIALDQRGTGASNTVPECRSNQVVPTATETSDRQFVEHHRAALQECLVFWRHHGVDLAGYNTVQNAEDLDALRQHLGAEQIVLWGTSYGSHLALAALKQMEDGIARVVVSSVEGLNQTIKLPARTDQYLRRLQEAVDSQPVAKAAYPDIKGLMLRVHAKLDRKPVSIKLKSRGGASVDYLLHRRDMQLLAAGMISDPRSAAQLLSIYRDVDRGVEPRLEHVPSRWLPDNLVDPGQPITLQGMPVAMDIASGMTADHRLTVLKQARAAVLGQYIDYALIFDGMARELDLGNAFRVNPTSDVPVLVLSGTLDGRTDLESQREAVSELKNATLIPVGNAGHNLLDETSNELHETVERFMEGREVHDAIVSIDLPDMGPKN